MQPCFRCLRTLLLYLHATCLAVQGISSFLERTAPTSVAASWILQRKDTVHERFPRTSHRSCGRWFETCVLHGNCWTDLNLGIDGGRSGITNLLASRGFCTQGCCFLSLGLKMLSDHCMPSGLSGPCCSKSSCAHVLVSIVARPLTWQAHAPKYGCPD
jgi:hypothetical protein